MAYRSKSLLSNKHIILLFLQTIYIIGLSADSKDVDHDLDITGSRFKEQPTKLDSIPLDVHDDHHETTEKDDEDSKEVPFTVDEYKESTTSEEKTHVSISDEKVSESQTGDGDLKVSMNSRDEKDEYISDDDITEADEIQSSKDSNVDEKNIEENKMDNNDADKRSADVSEPITKEDNYNDGPENKEKDVVRTIEEGSSISFDQPENDEGPGEVNKEEIDSKTFDKFPVMNVKESNDDVISTKITDDQVLESVGANDFEDEILVEEFFKDEPFQPAKGIWKFFTISPYLTIMKTIIKKLDPIITGIIFWLPPSLQSLFVRAPFNLYPTHAFLIFSTSCISFFIIVISKILQERQENSKSDKRRSLKESLFEMDKLLLLRELEREEVARDLKVVQSELKQKDEELENGTVEMNTNLKAIIKECDDLKMEVNKKMEKSRETKNETKKVESDVHKQSREIKDLQELMRTTKEEMKQLQNKRDKLQSSIDESELTSISLQEKIQCLSEDVVVKKESYNKMFKELSSKKKELDDLEGIVDALKVKCLQRSTNLEMKEKENKTLKTALLQLKIVQYLSDDDNDSVDNDDDDDDDEKKAKLEDKIKHLIFIAQMRRRMDEIEKEKESLKKLVSLEAETKIHLNEELKRMMEESKKFDQLREGFEQQALTSNMKIDVLSGIYTNNEREYNKKLQEKEAQEKAKSSEKKSAEERYREVDKMAAEYKNRVEILKRELERVQIDYEKQIVLQENRFHESNDYARKTKRDYEFKTKEAEMMRQNLLHCKKRIAVLESLMPAQKSTESLNASENKEDVRPANRNHLSRNNVPSPSDFKPPSASPHPSSIPPSFSNQPQMPFWLPRFMPPPPPLPRFFVRSRDDSPLSDRLRDLDDSIDERDRFPMSRNRSPLRIGPSPAYRNRSSPPPAHKERYTPETPDNRRIDSHYMNKGDGSHRTTNNN